MIEGELDTIGTAGEFDDQGRYVGGGWTRRRGVLTAIAAAAVVMVATDAVLDRTDQDRPQQASASAHRRPDTTTFQSALYNYSIALPATWKPVAATGWHGASNGHRDDWDTVKVPGTDTLIEMAGTYLGSSTYASWARRVHRSVLHDPAVPPACDGGKPSEWPRVKVGATEGYLLQKCNEALWFAPVGKRVYEFRWSNETFDQGHHYPESRFQGLLAGVTLPDIATADMFLVGPSVDHE